MQQITLLRIRHIRFFIPPQPSHQVSRPRLHIGANRARIIQRKFLRQIPSSQLTTTRNLARIRLLHVRKQPQ